MLFRSIFVTATAYDVCTGGSVSNQVSAYTSVICATPQGPKLVVPPLCGEGDFRFSIITEQGLHYTVEYTPSLTPPNWQTLTTFIGNGGAVTITDPANQAQRFYRVIVQP